MERVYVDVKNCVGCTACANSCPKHAISMLEDDKGFKYPVIDKTLCVDCKICQKVCPIIGKTSDKLKHEIEHVYAIKAKSDEIRLNSTSGGAFTIISDFVINNGGKVYGVILDDNLKAIHTHAITSDTRNKMRGSKYVQSDLKDTFKDIKEDIKKERLVMFVGTPCQVAGLKSYLGELTNYSNIILCDIVCHGVPSPKIFEEHVNYINNVAKKKVVDYTFRSKVAGWGHTENILFEDGKTDHTSFLSQAYKELFYSHKILRPSCFDCKFTDVKRVSDITFADFWGIEKTHKNFVDNKGISLLLINTKKGVNIFNNVKENVEYINSNIKECMQPQLKHPAIMFKGTDRFWDEYNKYGYRYVLKKYTNYGLKRRIINKIKNTLKRR